MRRLMGPAILRATRIYRCRSVMSNGLVSRSPVHVSHLKNLKTRFSRPMNLLEQVSEPFATHSEAVRFTSLTESH